VTCIVGVAHEGQVWIGGDSAGSDGWSTAVRSDTKVFQVGPYVMGFTTSFRMGQLLRYSLDVAAPDTWDVDRFMATTFMDAARRCLRDGGWMRTESGQEVGGQFLVGIGPRLYTVDSDFQIGHTVDGYAAVGSGELTALGSLHTTAALQLPVEQRVTAALEAAAYATCFVRAPFTVVTTPR
jgi:ATP-dependent protease HslVU (ClpYQ) peptidase subunit